MAEEGKGGQGGGQPGSGAGQGAGDSGQITIEINGEQKVLKADDVKVMAGQVSELQQLKEQFAPFSKVLLQYGVRPEEYLQNSESAFALANQLIEAGVIDDKGNILAKKASGGTPAFPQKTDAGNLDQNSSGSKGLQVVLDALTKISGRIDGLEEGQSGIYRRNIERDVKGVHSNLESEDVAKLLAKAKADKSKGFWDHAEAMSKEKTVREKGARQGVTKEVIATLVKAGIIPEGKIDLDKLDLDALKAEDKNDLSGFYVGKKFIFPGRLKRLKDAKVDVSGYANPTEAMKEMTDKRFHR